MGRSIVQSTHQMVELLKEKNVPFLIGGSVALGLMRGPLDWMLALLLLEQSGPELIGIAFALANVDDTIMAFVGGQLADRYGRRPLVIIATGFYIVGCLVLLMSQISSGSASTLLLCAAVIILYGVTGVSSGPYSALVSESVSACRLGRAFASLALTVSLSRAGGSALIGLIFALNRVLAITIMLTWSIVGCICHIMLKETLSSKDEGQEMPSLMANLRMSASGLRDSLRQGFRPVIALVALVGLGHATCGYYYTPYLTEGFSLPEAWIGTLYSIMFVFQSLAMPVAGWLIDNHGVVPALVIGNVVPGICLIVLSVTGSPALASAAVLAAGTLSGLGSLGERVAVNRLARPELRATLFGVTMGVSNSMYVVGPIVGGLLYSKGHSLPFVVASVVLLLTVVPVIGIRNCIRASDTSATVS